MMASTALEILIKASDQASGTLKNVAKESGGLGDKLKFLAVAAAGAVTALVSIKTLQSVIGTTQDLGSAVNKLKRETGDTAEESSKLLYAFKRVGLSGDEASTSLGILAKKLKGVSDEETGVTTGGKSTADILADIGIKAFTTTGQLAPMGQIMPQIAEVFKNMPDGIEKTGLAMQLFGRSGKDMIPVLNQGSEGLKALGEDAERFGLVLSEQGVADIKAYTGAQRELGAAFDGIKIAIGLAIMPALTDLTTAFADALPTVRVFITEGLDKIGDFLTAHEEDIRNFGQALLDLGEQGFQRLTELGPPLVTILTNLATVFQDVAANLVPLLAGALSDVASLLQDQPALVYAIIAVWASFQIGSFIQDLVGLAAGLVGVATASGVATGGVVALRGALMTTGIGALIVGLATAAYFVYTNWSWIWPKLQNFVIDTYNVAVPYINGLVNAVEALTLGLVDLPEAMNKANVAAGSAAEANAEFGNVCSEVTKSCTHYATPALAQFALQLESKIPHAVDSADKTLMGMTTTTEGLIPPVLDLGAGLQGVGGGAGAAAKALDDLRKKALEAQAAALSLFGATALFNATLQETDAIQQAVINTLGGVVSVENVRIGILEQQIAQLGRYRDSLSDTGEGNDILKDAVQGTIDRLQDQVDTLSRAKNQWVLFGTEGIGPVTAAITAMNDAISEQTSGISGLLSVQTQEEADLIARIANYDAQIAGLDAVTAATQALTDAERDRLNLAQGRSASDSAEIEKIEDYMAIINEMERRKRENGTLTIKEQQAYADALRKLNALEKEQWTTSNVHEKAQERIWDLQQESERNTETVDSLEKLAETRTKEGKAAIDSLKAERDPLQKRLDAILATKDAQEKGLEARAKGRPTMETWIKLLVGEGIEHGLITEGVLAQIPALHDWATSHGQTVFDIAKGLQLLEVGQDTFLRNTETMLDNWTAMWGTAAAEVATAMAGVGSPPEGAAAAVPSAQGGGYIRRSGLVYVDAGENIRPARISQPSIAGPGSAHEVHIHIEPRGVFLAERREVEELWEKYLKPLVRREFH
jgi:hypothetical protein